MAGDWIMMRIDLRDDPATIAIAKATRKDVDLIVGKLLRIWGWANRNTTDGISRQIDAAWIDRYVTCKGFAEAMRVEGWLVIGDGSIQFPEYERYNGAPAKRRNTDRIRKRLARKKADNVRKQSGQKADARAEQVAISSPSPLPVNGSEEKEWPANKIPPPVEAVRAFCESIKTRFVDPQAFVNHYTANGWKVGGKAPMKDWQAAVWNWHHRDEKDAAGKAKLSIEERAAASNRALEKRMQEGT